MLKKIILITGANGEMGNSLIRALNKQGIFNIVAIDLHALKYNFKIDKFIQGSILDIGLLANINESYIVQSIYHLAAILSTDAENNPSLANDVNINGTANMLELCNQQAKKQHSMIQFFFPSSIAVYNASNQKLIKVKESHNDNLPITNYGRAKLKCEKLGVNMHNNSKVAGTDFRSIRFPGIISGTSMPCGGTSDYAPEMIHYAAQNKTYHCYVHSDRQLPFITMPDAINAILKIMKHEQSKLTQNVYNVTSFNPSVEDFYDKIKEYFLNFRLVYEIDFKREQIVDSWPNNIDDSYARNDWGWLPKHDLNSAFKDYLIPKMHEKYNLIIL